MNTEEIFEILKSKFELTKPELITDPVSGNIISVHPLEVDKISLFLRDEDNLLFDSLMNLSGVDEEDGEKATDEFGNSYLKGGNLSVYYHLESTSLKHKLILKTTVSKQSPEVASVSLIWRHADWQEREAFDMFGIVFLNHPDLRRILMPYDWQAGYPLRKDYKNPEFYNGMKVPY